MKSLITYFMMMLVFLSCKTIEYEDDLTYLSPEKGNNPNYLVKVNGFVCKDIAGNIGNCAIKNQENQRLTIDILKQPYRYTIDFRCGNSSGIKFRENRVVFKDSPHSFFVPVEVLKGNTYFNCVGDIIPEDDRHNDASNFFEIRVRIFSEDYIEPMQIFTTFYKRKKYLVLGKNAYRAKVKIGRSWYHLKKQTVFRYKNKIDFAMVETKNMRRAYYGEL